MSPATVLSVSVSLCLNPLLALHAFRSFHDIRLSIKSRRPNIVK